MAAAEVAEPAEPAEPTALARPTQLAKPAESEPEDEKQNMSYETVFVAILSGALEKVKS